MTDVDEGPFQSIQDHRRALGVDNLKGLTPKHSRPTCFIDCETTGLGGPRYFSSGKRQILDICAIKVRPKDGLLDVYESKARLEPMAREHAQPKAMEIVGYSDEEWAGAPPLMDVMAATVRFLSGCAVVGHNLEQDWCNFILPTLIPYWIPQPTCFPLICTEKLARDMLPGLESYTLAAMCQHYGIEEEGEHRARGGAERCKKIYEHLISS